jgi:hypothetical protein
LELPDVTHKEVMEWCLAQKRPFTANIVSLDKESEQDNNLDQDSRAKNSKRKDAGYKDFLIWKSIKELLQSRDDCSVIFITNDGDFFESKIDALHEHLVTDLHDVRNGINRIEVFKSLAAFVSSKQNVLEGIPLEYFDQNEFDRLVWNSPTQLLVKLMQDFNAFYIVPSSSFTLTAPALLEVQNLVEVNKDQWSISAKCSQIHTLQGSVFLPDGTEQPLPHVREAFIEKVIFSFNPRDKEITNVAINKIQSDFIDYLEVLAIPITTGWKIETKGPVQLGLQAQFFEDAETASFCLSQLLSLQATFVGSELRTFSRIPISHAVLRKWNFLPTGNAN